MKDTCRLCLKERELQESHVIPNAFFRRIFSSGGGQAIRFDTAPDTHIENTEDSLDEYMLCSKCERHLNESYESKAIHLLRGHGGFLRKTAEGVVLRGQNNIELLYKFFISIIWRAAVSENEKFREVTLPSLCLEVVRNAILNDVRLDQRLCTVKIVRVRDRKGGRLSDEEIKQILSTVFVKIYSESQGSYCFMVEGFWVEVFFPRLQHSKRGERGVLHLNKETILLPFKELVDIDDLHKSMMIGLEKHRDKKSKV